MQNLDDSLNTISLDESFCNARGAVETAAVEVPLTVSSLQPKPLLVNFTPKVVAAPKVITAPIVAKPISVPEPIQMAFPPMLGGGGGAGVSEPVSEPSSAEKVSEEKELFGIKANYVYGLGIIAALTFVYFKFIKK